MVKPHGPDPNVDPFWFWACTAAQCTDTVEYLTFVAEPSHLKGTVLTLCRTPSLMSVGSLSRKMSGSFTSAWKRASQSGTT